MLNCILARQVKTQQVDQFKEVTAGVDRLFSIRSVGLHHQGTYQCEIYSGQRPIVSLYFYLSGNRIHHCLRELIFGINY